MNTRAFLFFCSLVRTSVAAFLLGLLAASPAAAIPADSFKQPVNFANFRILREDGSEITKYGTYLVFGAGVGNLNFITGYMDSDDPKAMLHPTITTTSTRLPDDMTSVSAAINLSVPSEGYSRTTPLPDGRQKVQIKNRLANWWTATGESIVSRDGSLSNRLEFRDKANKLIYVYTMESHPATPRELAIFEKRKKAALAFVPSPDDSFNYTYERSQSAYPDAIEKVHPTSPSAPSN